MSQGKEKNSIAREVAKWLDKQPYIRVCLAQHLVNYSSLARRVQAQLNIKNFDAVMVAIRRYSKTLKGVQDISTKLQRVLSNSRLEIRTGINVYVLNQGLSEYIKELSGYVHIIKGFEYYLLITDTELGSPFSKKHENLVEIRIKSPEEIESTPGVVFYIYEKLFERNINIIETYSCWTDTLILIQKNELVSALEALEELGVS
ncbi:hypothetical protein DRJ48_02845 [Candidatus Woesearchaeota archaeon]|nr:ACT domain-containing protein [Candidatus Woesearchaeota archaeon]RLE42761.1 MAG: hypothetical protein DRJ48_02845 [Candidatus Woesearchaeota archaeon]